MGGVDQPKYFGSGIAPMGGAAWQFCLTKIGNFGKNKLSKYDAISQLAFVVSWKETELIC